MKPFIEYRNQALKHKDCNGNEKNLAQCVWNIDRSVFTHPKKLPIFFSILCLI
jgi:hypothetical protein